MSYSILINNENESAIYNMTFYRTGSGTVCHDVSQDDADGLTINQNYTLKVIASASFADSEPTSACHEFGKLEVFSICTIIIEGLCLYIDTVFNSAYKTQCNDFLLTLIFTVPCVLNNTYYK